MYDPAASTSNPVEKNVRMASLIVQTRGSPLILNEVFNRTGVPVRAPKKARRRRWNRGRTSGCRELDPCRPVDMDDGGRACGEEVVSVERHVHERCVGVALVPAGVLGGKRRIERAPSLAVFDRRIDAVAHRRIGEDRQGCSAAPVPEAPPPSLPETNRRSAHGQVPRPLPQQCRRPRRRGSGRSRARV